jgi:citrate lyase subunit beta/citryl-CoA lyase
MRSKLFVPGSRPELFSKALGGQADAISIDLEDSVVAERKSEARAFVSLFLKSNEVRESSKTLIVRVNGLDTPHFGADVESVVHARLAMLNLPKVESADDILAAVAVLERAEAKAGIDTPIRLLANVESPKGLRFADEIAAAHPRVAGLQLGFIDLFEPLGIDRYDKATLHAVMLTVRMAAGASGVFAYDGAFPDVQDVDGFRSEAAMARRLGFLGKSCIHPRQVDLANDVFMSQEWDLAYAMRVLSASEEAKARGAGAFLLDGRMIDAPGVRRAQAVLAVSKGAPLTDK